MNNVKANRKDNDGAVDDLLDARSTPRRFRNLADDAKHDRADDGAYAEPVPPAK